MNGQGVEKDLQKAEFWLLKAAEAGIVEAQSNLGQMYYFEKNYQEAAYWLLKAAKENLASAQNNLAVMYSEGLGVKQNKERAIYWLQKAADQGDSTARKNLAMLVLDQPEAAASRTFQDDTQSSVYFSTSAQDNTEAAADISVTESIPDFASRQAAKEHFNKGNMYAKDGQFDAAISEYNKAIGLDPGNSNTYENLAISYAKTGNFQNAVKTMQTAIRLNPDDAMKYSTLGIIYHADNKLQQALEQYDRSVSLNPGYGEMYYNMAVIYIELGQTTSAYRFFRQAQSLGYAESGQALLLLKKNNPEFSEISENNSVLHLRHIVTANAEEAELILGRLHNGDDFVRLASQFSLPPYNLNGGYVGPFAPGELQPAISEIVAPLAPLALSPVIETSTGYHIFQKFKVDANLPPSS